MTWADGQCCAVLLLGPCLTGPQCLEWDDKEEGNEAVQQWEDDWDDDDVNDDFSLQLRKELESIPSKN
uniref:26S proteasome complex subunit SEM1 n=1 Tax=Oryza meridionalis TaxID=40149 RepID=A0A0E0DCC9_9ORYZ